MGQRWAVGAIGLALIVVACGTAQPLSTASGAPQSPTSSEPSGEPGGDRRGGTLILPNLGDPKSLTPAFGAGTPERFVGCKMFEGLLRVDGDNTLWPALAEDWSVTDDGLKYTFNLREGVTWHDGQPFTSEDVKWTYENVSSVFGPRTTAAFKSVASIETPDEHTVILNMSSPYGVLPYLLQCSESAILPKHIYGDGQDLLSHPRNVDNPIGTGPFKFVSFEPGQAITMERYDGYWRSAEGLPYLDRVIVRPIASSDAVINALEAGDIDFVPSISLDKAAYLRLRDRPAYQGKENTNNPGNLLLIFNTKRQPFDDVRVRQALFHAIDRQAIVDKVFFGLGKSGKGAIDSRLAWAHNPAVDYDTMYPHDSARAASLLDEAGLKPDQNGIRLRMSIPYDAGNPDFVNLSQIIAQNFKDAGVEVKLEPLEFTVDVQKVHVDEDFDAAIQSYTTLGDPALGIQRLYITSAIGPNPFTNASSYSNPEVDDLFAKGAAAATQEERASFYREVEAILARDVPTLVLGETPSPSLAKASLRGLWRGTTDFEWWDEVYYEK